MAEPQNATPQRVSRYRSQRKAQQQAQAAEAPQVPDVPEQQDAPVDDGVARSRSRYHRRNVADSRPTTARPTTSRDQGQVDVGTWPPNKAQSPPHRAPRPVNRGVEGRYAGSPARAGAPDLRRLNSDGYGDEDGSNERARLNGPSVERQAEPAHSPSLPQMYASPASQPSGELFPPIRLEPTKSVEQPPRRDGPPVSSHIQATKSVSELPIYNEDEQRGGGCFGLFKRKRSAASPAPEKTPIARPSDGPRTIMPGGGGVVPGTDAPVSAVNAGDRSVLVECGKTKRVFPVTPTTTPVDLIKSAATCMSERIDVRSAVILEHFGSVGVQRPLRRYEHVRDVMNSWNDDRQNSLLLVDPGTGSSEVELSIAGVPREKPGDVSWLLTYSQKPGKWDKRFITLKSDGQITQQKDPNKPQQQENICHMSDFDIYTPTQTQLRKRIKPPKKTCFAIKSQQKTSMFESTQNFVHFLCTNDKATADEFYNAVQGWRSWYLVNVMGEGKKKKPAAEATAAEKETGGSYGATRGHRREESFSSHYELGSFKPLIDMEQLEKKTSVPRMSVENARPTSSGGNAKSVGQFGVTMSSLERMGSTSKRKQHPPVALGKHAELAEDEPLANFGRRASMDQKRGSLDQARGGSDEFATSGLLGRTYTQRQREHAEREKQREQPFTVGNNLLSGVKQDDYARPQSQDGPRRGASTRAKGAHNISGSDELRRHQSTRNRGSVDLGRSGSTRAREKPLLDLTPENYAPPQFSMKGKGKGFRPDQPGPGGLIDNATSPDDPLNIPPSTDWRGRNSHNNSPGTYQQEARHRERSASRPGTSRAPNSGHGEGFTGGGLLASGHGTQGWGGGDRGRGVIDGSRAKGPMLDVNEPSKFVPGSLLNR